MSKPITCFKAYVDICHAVYTPDSVCHMLHTVLAGHAFYLYYFGFHIEYLTLLLC